MKIGLIKKIAVAVCCIIFAIGVCTIAINIHVLQYAKPYIYSNIDTIPRKYAVIVPGAKVYKHTVSHVVRDRIDAAVNCVKAGKAERFLISGDHGTKDYDEVNQMRIFMQKIYAVNEDLIFMDHAGFSTYETMYRAKNIFCVNNALVVTQKFHAARAVYIARKLGIDIAAYEAPEINPYRKETHITWEVREILARVKSFFLVLFSIKPSFLGAKIPINGNSKDTWDML